ncbi:MAG: class I SAM-dependent methyltransferase [Proteobacteria bacterium]|nr:class I SAM-dependent methyltransferase [Pseudomonadota bacterium]
MVGANIFDRQLLKSNRDRACATLDKADFIYNEIADQIAETIGDFKQDFNSILEIGARKGALGQRIKQAKKAQKLIQTDCSDKMVKAMNSNHALVMDDEFLAFEDESFDLVISNCNFHLINDPVGALIQINKTLKKGGFFIASFFGGETLKALRDVFEKSELQYYGGVSPRLIPFIDVKSAGALMQRAGFNSVVSHSEDIEIAYDNPIKLLQDLKHMGESNILFKRSKKFASKGFLSLVENKYRDLYADDENRCLANFEIVTVSGWKSL